MGRKKKERYCKCCGDRLPQEHIWLCESCQAAGFGLKMRRDGTDGRELLAVARARDGKIPPFADMGMEEIAAIAKLFKAPYNSYGKLKGYVTATLRMPPVEYERRDEE